MTTSKQQTVGRPANPPSAVVIGSAPRWEHGYRCHGYWLDPGTRVGRVSIGPRRLWDGTYHCEVKLDGGPLIEWDAGKHLATAKRQVERIYLQQLQAQNAKVSDGWPSSDCRIGQHGGGPAIRSTALLADP